MTIAINSADIINLDSYGTPDLELERQGWGVPAPESWVVDTKFRQTDVRRKSSTLFKRINRHYLVIRRQQRQQMLPEQVVDLSFVEARPREIRKNRLWLWALALACLLAPLGVYSTIPYLPLWGAPPVALAALMMAMAWRGRQHRYEFVALNTSIPVFSVDGRLPGKSAANAFLAELEQVIVRAQQSLPAGKKRIPLAVTEMRRLYQAGVIAEEDYETAKRRWFADN